MSHYDTKCRKIKLLAMIFWLFIEGFMSETEKFLSKIVKNANDLGCWQLISDDKSQFRSFFYFKRKRFRAKKFSYEYFNGKVKTGLKVLCKCNNPLCINPEHHFVGNGTDQINLILARGWKHKKGWKRSPEVIAIISKTHKGKIIPQELRDRLSKANIGNRHSEAAKRKISRGHIGIEPSEESKRKNAFAKQGEKNYNTRLTTADVLKIRSLEGKMTLAEGAERFAVSPAHIYSIWRRRVWKHI